MFKRRYHINEERRGKNYYTIRGDRYDGGVDCTVVIDGKQVYKDWSAGNHPWEYNGKKYDHLPKMIDQIAKDHGLNGEDDLKRISNNEGRDSVNEETHPELTKIADLVDGASLFGMSKILQKHGYKTDYSHTMNGYILMIKDPKSRKKIWVASDKVADAGDGDLVRDGLIFSLKESVSRSINEASIKQVRKLVRILVERELRGRKKSKKPLSEWGDKRIDLALNLFENTTDPKVKKALSKVVSERKRRLSELSDAGKELYNAKVHYNSAKGLWKGKVVRIEYKDNVEQALVKTRDNRYFWAPVDALKKVG